MFFSYLFIFLFSFSSYCFSQIPENFNLETCGRKDVKIFYTEKFDALAGCEGIKRAEKFATEEYGYIIGKPIIIHFKPEVTINLKGSSDVLPKFMPVYGIFIRETEKIEMSSFKSNIVQKKERINFGIKIQLLPLSQEKKDELIKEIHTSVVAHEVTHFLSHQNFTYEEPSPAVHEYLSYVAQLSTIDKSILNMALEATPEVFDQDSHINAFIHGHSPHNFGVKSYKHYYNLGERKKKFMKETLSGEFNPDLMLTNGSY